MEFLLSHKVLSFVDILKLVSVLREMSADFHTMLKISPENILLIVQGVNNAFFCFKIDAISIIQELVSRYLWFEVVERNADTKMTVGTSRAVPSSIPLRVFSQFRRRTDDP